MCICRLCYECRMCDFVHRLCACLGVYVLAECLLVVVVFSPP